MAFDLTDDAVEIAIIATKTAVTAADFVPADWVRNAPNDQAQPLSPLSTAYRYVKVTATVTNTDGSKESDSAWVRVLLGPDGDLAPPAGTNDVHVHVTDSPEDIYLKAGKLTVA